jgi:hypothetical protein
MLLTKKYNSVILGLTLAVASLFFLLLPSFSFAQDCRDGVPISKCIKDFQGNVGEKSGFDTDDATANPTVFLQPLIAAIFGVTGIIFFVYMFFGGYLWFTSGGDAEQLKKGHTAIRNAIIGLAIVLGSYSITAFVLTKILGG